MSEYISREAAKEKCCSLCRWEGTDNCSECEHPIDDIPAADVRPTLWTDDPISGTEFMTHNQGQRGFEIHFRTDDKTKYEAVQAECRRQIGHAKPAADVRPVVLCRDCRHRDPEDHKCDSGEMERQGCVFPVDDDYFCAYGER